MAAAFAEVAAKGVTSAAVAHLVLEPSAAGLECELVGRLEQIEEGKTARRARGRARASGEGGADSVQEGSAADAMEE